jgi:hypothetical protein
MVKAAKKITPKTDVELNRWCVEMAMKWPVVTTFGGNGAVYSAGGGLPTQQIDADVIGRALKIRNWVTAA